MGLTRWNDLHPGFGRRNRPRASAGGGFEADLGTARGRLCRAARCRSVGTVRAAAKMGFLAISALPTIAEDSGKAPGLVPCTAARQPWGGGMRARGARRAARADNFLFFKLIFYLLFIFIFILKPHPDI